MKLVISVIIVTMNQNAQEYAGKYRHYKGNKYEVIGIGKHTETGDKLVIYRALHEPHEIWVRPFDMFFETISVDNKDIQRFERLKV